MRRLPQPPTKRSRQLPVSEAGGAAIAAAFENASIDNRHIDGGIERKNEQPVSLAMVNELLNELHNEAFWSRNHDKYK